MMIYSTSIDGLQDIISISTYSDQHTRVQKYHSNFLTARNCFDCSTASSCISEPESLHKLEWI